MSAVAATASIDVLDPALLVDGVTTLTVGGKVYTFVTGAPTSSQIAIAATAALTAANIAIRVSTDTATTLCTAAAGLGHVALTANTGGLLGNSIALSETAIPTALTVTAFAGGTDYDTTYATVADLRPLIGGKTADTSETTRLQRLLNTAARLFDEATHRHAPEGQEAYSASASSTRYFDDVVCALSVDIDDAVSIATVVRGDTTLTLDTQYKLLPLNRGNGPITSIEFAYGVSITRVEAFTNYQRYDIVTGGIAVTGTWGYCVAANRPAAINNAVLDLASVMYKTGALTINEVMQMITPQNPYNVLARNVKETVEAFKRRPVARFV